MTIFKRLIIVIFAINLFSTIYVIFLLIKSDKNYYDDNQSYLHHESNDNEDNENWNEIKRYYNVTIDEEEKQNVFEINKTNKLNSNQIIRNIEIWSKAAIGEYFWEHIFDGKIDKYKNGGFHFFNLRKINNYNILFRAGPSLTVQSLKNYMITKLINHNQYLINIVLILNGRAEDKVRYSRIWLNEVISIWYNYSSNHEINFGAILLGNENCFNNWIKPFLSINGGPLKFLFTVYDWDAIDNDVIYQWPLGVATYRKFPSPDLIKINLQLNRPYICNFLGSVYSNSSRVDLLNILNHTQQCFFKPRFNWQSQESKESLQTYLESLKLSDLTLSPIGMNHECYRIYEAISFGSVPVLEENLNHVKDQKSNCDKSSAYRLFKRFKAPFIFVKNWTIDLPLIIENELKLPQEYKLKRRINLLKWYKNFKYYFRDHFLNVIEKKFYPKQN